MAIPTDKKRHGYQFTDDITFFQKAVIMHPLEEKFLIVKRSDRDKIRPGTWDLPGGNILYGELHIEGLRREIVEEVNLRVKNINPANIITHFNKTIPMYYIIIGFRCQALGENVKLSSEHSEFQWTTKEAFLSMDSKYHFREERIFDTNSTDFLRDMVYCAFR